MKTSIPTLLAVSLTAGLMTILTLGCGEDSRRSQGDLPYYVPENFQTLENELEMSEFYCSEPGPCLPNVGLLYINSNINSYNPRIQQCTSFLVGDDIIGTNSHCLTPQLKASKDACKSHIAVRFLDGSGKKRIFGCKEILDFSPLEDVLGPDYAFIKIEPTGIEPLQIYKNGMRDNQNIKVAKVTPLTSGRGGRLETDTCKVGLNTLLNIKGTNAWSKTAVALGCEGTGGNSGSPILNEAGQVMGILQSKMLDTFRRILENTFARFRIKLPSTMPPHVIFTSLSCVADPVTGISNDQKCSVGEGLGITDCTNFGGELTEQKERQFYEAWRNSLPGIFVYEYTTDAKTLISVAKPICVKTQAQFPDYKKLVKQKGTVGFRKDNLSLTYAASIKVLPLFKIDSGYRFYPELNLVEERRLTYKIEVVKTDSRWTGKSYSTYSDKIDGLDFSNFKIPVSLPDCTNDQLSAAIVNLIKTPNGEIITAQQYKDRHLVEKKVCEK